MYRNQSIQSTHSGSHAIAYCKPLENILLKRSPHKSRRLTISENRH
ncbi:hypothetical protein APA_2158 [Pseudanabaena sp. lw0831]|nr:hypothetical protein APA_2158 [Pseudanabaena sp. lw0831]